MQASINFEEVAIKTLSEHGIIGSDVPSIINSFKPAGNLLVKYGDEETVVSMGNKLEPAQTAELPSFMLTVSSAGDEIVKDGDLVTLILTDPDAPSRTDHKWSEFLHYMEINMVLHTDDEVSFVPLEGETIARYVGPGPPAGTGPHRYIWLLYKQPNGRIVEENADQLRLRKNWGYKDVKPPVGVEKWASEKGLQLIGANFFYAENK
ncbi:HCL632Cp [Eremothecium sinecaudum]|uniref:HCL632Cp n=1 Tax=Eremothecium sinecaudum TaxID=45286 RepID=A0A120K1L7_9SACH|nr:HCL632Cp [Eremothecium sinecaudum]AMD19519.1 HCL632Cp [Eremothecium sinecaudum]